MQGTDAVCCQFLKEIETNVSVPDNLVGKKVPKVDFM